LSEIFIHNFYHALAVTLMHYTDIAILSVRPSRLVLFGNGLTYYHSLFTTQ